MADIFISYANADRPVARRLAEALEAHGWSVWWDHRSLRGGQHFDRVIEEAIRDAEVVVVVWSKASVKSEWVQDEATLALRMKKLVPLRIDMARLPMRFSNIHTVDLASWDGKTDAEPFKRLVKDLGYYLGPTAFSSPASPGSISLRRDGLSRYRWKYRHPRVHVVYPDLSKISTPPPVDQPPQIRDAQFTVYHPKEVAPERWDTMLVYAYISKMQEWVYEDAQARLGQAGSYGQRSDRAKQDIAKGAEIVVVPELPGCQFNPPTDRFHWFEDVHRREFRLRPTPEVVGFELGKAVNGRVAFYIGPILIAEVAIWAFISNQAGDVSSNHERLSPPVASAVPMCLIDTSGMAESVPSSILAEHNITTSIPYNAIFVSYAHEDSFIVKHLGVAYKALGMRFLRDQEVLRSGEKWNPALLCLIEQADIFQLFWSRAARQSRYVEQEWRHALQQNRGNFIRPVYWQKPMPEPPKELEHIHFSYYTKCKSLIWHKAFIWFRESAAGIFKRID
jgi:hypothetical protein